MAYPRGEWVSVWVFGGVFGLVPSVLPVSLVAAVLIGGAGVILVGGWRLRIVLGVFVVAEACGLPWPAAPILTAACFFSRQPGTLLRQVRERGTSSRPSMALVLVVVLSLAAGAGVVALDWANVRAGYVFAFPVPPPWSFPWLAVGAALVNAIGEEALWRGVLADVGQRLLGTQAAFALQALSFGVAHLHGIPNGVLGVLAAAVYSAFVYGVSIRLGARGAFVAHLMTDLVIFLVVMQFAQFAWNG